MKAADSRLYSNPAYYDVAFSWDISAEVAVLQRLLRMHVPFPVRTVLEPACGSGRFLVALPGCGYRVLGYDASRSMVSYARRRISEAGLASRAFVAVADMRSARFEPVFDAALNSINSLGYLLSDDDVLTHLRGTGDALKPGGVYLVHLACAWDALPRDEGGTWTMEKGGIRVRTTWSVLSEDRQAKLSRQLCRMDVDDHGSKLHLEERHDLRLWLFEDLVDLASRSGAFELAATYDEQGGRIGPGVRVTGELGNLFHVLRRV